MNKNCLPCLRVLPTGAPDISIRLAKSLIFSIVFCCSLFVILYLYIWPLLFLSFELRLLVTCVHRLEFSHFSTDMFHLSYHLKTLPVLSSFITWFVTRVTRRVALVEQELLTLSEHQSSPPIFNEVCVTRSLVFYVVLCISLFVLLCFCVGNCAVCPSIYGF